MSAAPEAIQAALNRGAPPPGSRSRASDVAADTARGAVVRGLSSGSGPGIAPDLATYADVKDPVVDLVVAVAEPWARDTG
ncbi:hypothetical protein ACFXKG_02670 [Streptomyces sp. NPDC059255]|uniref:hypothetical protein n=1 Tax=Streptomyces sp. NPDC059255 TaxID=3346793 RepID=UPI0036D1F41F